MANPKSNSKVRQARNEEQRIVIERRQIIGEIDIERDNPNGTPVIEAALKMIASEIDESPAEFHRYEFKFGREIITVEHEVAPDNFVTPAEPTYT